MLLSLFTGRKPMHLLNVYSDAQHTAITWLSRNIARLPPVSYMGSDFNSYNAVWDDGVLHQHWDSNLLVESAQLMGLDWAWPSNYGPIYYPHANSLRPSVIDLVFLEVHEVLHKQLHLLNEMRNTSDHVLIYHTATRP